MLKDDMRARQDDDEEDMQDTRTLRAGALWP